MIPFLVQGDRPSGQQSLAGPIGEPGAGAPGRVRPRGVGGLFMSNGGMADIDVEWYHPQDTPRRISNVRG